MMRARERRKRRKAESDEAIHIVALWNLMLILIPFLLLSAAFSETTILNLMIPSSASAGEPKKETGPVKDQIRLLILKDAFQVKQGETATRDVPMSGGGYDFQGLAAALAYFRSQNPGEESIVLSSAPKVPYEILVRVMDQCRDSEFKNILLGPDLNG